MDPLSITAGIIALLQGAHVGAQGLRKLKWYCKYAAEDLEDLALEVDSIASSLGDVQSFVALNKSLEYSASLSLPVARAGRNINDINDLLSSPPFRISRLNNANQARLTWLRHGTKARSLRDDLRVAKMDLVVQLSVVHAASSGRLEQSLGQLSKQVTFIFENIANSKMDNNYFTGFITNSPIQSAGRETSSVRDRAEPSAPSPDGPTLQDFYDREKGSSSIAIRSEMKDPKTNTCTAWCSCACHVTRRLKSPMVISYLVGEIKIQYDGVRPDCNEHQCRRSSSISFSTSYRFPRYLMNRYLFTTGRYHPLEGPQFSLRIPRVMPWSHLLWRYANNQDLAAIQGLFSERKASPFDLNLHGSNALLYAADHSDAPLCRFLIQQGAEPENEDEAGVTASRIMWENALAGQFGVEGISIVGSMLHDTEFTETRNFTLIHKIILGIIPKDLNAELELSTACIDQGDSRDRTPLHWAVIRNDLSAVDTLLAYSANPNAADEMGHTPLDFVSNAEVCSSLLKAGVDVHHRSSVYRRSPLHCLCRTTGNVEVIDLLVNAGVSVDVRTIDEETPLHNAIFMGRKEASKRLIELGADVNAFNKSSQDNAVHFAVSFDRHEIMSFLLEADADCRPINKRGRSVLHMAARYASTKTLAMLTGAKLRGVPIGLRDEDGKTADEYMAERAILSDREEGVHAQFADLLKSLASPNSVEIDGRGSRLIDLDETPDIESQLPHPSDPQPPGAYPILADEKESECNG